MCNRIFSGPAEYPQAQLGWVRPSRYTNLILNIQHCPERRITADLLMTVVNNRGPMAKQHRGGYSYPNQLGIVTYDDKMG